MGAYDLLGATGDWRCFLRRAKDNGAWGVRLFVQYAWNSAPPCPLYKRVGSWTHPTTHTTFPLYRLGTLTDPSWNPNSWEHIREVLAEMKKLGLVAILAADDFCSLKGNKTTKYFHPFYCSEEALSPTTPGGIWGEAMKRYHTNLYWEIIRTAKNIGVIFFIEPMNEYDIVDGTDTQVVAWHKWATDRIVSLGVPRARLLAAPGRCKQAIAGQVGVFSIHQIGRAEQVSKVLNIPVAKTLYSSDGFKTGGGNPDASGHGGVGTLAAGPLAQKIIALGGFGFDLMDRGLWHDNNDRANLDDFDPRVLKIMAYGGAI